MYDSRPHIVYKYIQRYYPKIINLGPRKEQDAHYKEPYIAELPPASEYYLVKNRTYAVARKSSRQKAKQKQG